MAAKVLVVDDKLNVQALLTEVLTLKGFEVECASHGIDALLRLKSFAADIILLDIMMPQMDGYQFIKELRKTSEVPVIMITAKQHESDVVKGFELGADDYIFKPFKMSELIVRIYAVLKRTANAFSNEPLIRAGNLSLNTTTREAWLDSQLIQLTLVEITLLTILMRSAEHTVNKEKISCQLIEKGYSGSESTLKIHIRNLRNKLELFSNSQVEIESVFGLGYRLKAVKQ
ncbi:response regulator transcription factor [Vibrio sp. F74]|uniref:response regulator transcription factor n=1 Tax=Vibrio sp. F74 TaxID=700020 RepID=UPI0035F57FB3